MSGTPGHLEQSPSVPAHILSEVFRRDCRETQGTKMPRMSDLGGFENRRAATKRVAHANSGGNAEFHSESAPEYKNEQCDACAAADYAYTPKSSCSGTEDCLEQAAFTPASCATVCQSHI